ncbi:hypothetical protein ACFQ68_27475 [Amycolatopsis japonica]|uniref:hypothetical protein n=1 Tax=Amycolatopsis japonica TaxID=208439 RepID=UPI00366B744B
MDLDSALKISREVEAEYVQINESKGRAAWGVSEYMQGLVGDIGDLAKLVMAKQGFRDVENVDEKLRHELADCLWSLLIISEKLDIDLAETYAFEMKALLAKLSERR